MDACDQARWQQGAVAKLQRIAALEDNWDTYGSRPIPPTVVARMLDVLDVVAFPRMPEPAVVPTPEGGIQLEWHIRNLDLEVEVSPRESALIVSLDDQDADEALEETLLPGSYRFSQVLQRLVARSESTEP
jgi:hypothetical protein